MFVSFCDESESGFGWIAAEPDWLGRTSHALVSDGDVWLVDPVDFAGLDERVAALGRPRGVLQLLDRHGRDCAALSARLGVPHLITPAELPGSPFEPVRVKGRGGWRETALWWPEQRTLIVAEAVGTVRFYCAPGRSLGVNPVLRLLRPPTVLLGFAPEHILCGHGWGVHDGASDALQHAVRCARRELPAVLPRLAVARRHSAL
jgi:hypothetical protein